MSQSPQPPSTTKIGLTLERTKLGLALHLSTRSPAPIQHQTLFADDIFRCETSNIRQLLHHIVITRRDITDRLLAGDTVTILVPQVDPPVIRITNRSEHGMYFNLGELWRWRLLRQLPEYPYKDHQITGAIWLTQRSAAILADDMGLGKSLQAIAAFEHIHRARHIQNALIVCPKSLIGTWEAEFTLWAPRFCIVALHSTLDTQDWNAVAGRCHVAITNYEALRHRRPAAGAFDLVIFDEIHRLKNPASLSYAAAYTLSPQMTWGLSGTPLENHAGDLVAVLHLLDKRRVARSDRYLPTNALRSLASRYILRRKKQILSSELPEVIDNTELLPLSPEQQHAYDRTRRTQHTSNFAGWITNFNQLRNICDYDPVTKASSKIDRALAILGAVKALKQKAIVFSWRLEPLRILQERLSTAYDPTCISTITGSTASTTRSTIVNSFQTKSIPFVLLCSTRATAEGLTLTAANHVIFLNEWWNPAVNAQARDRVNRIGQTRTVYVYRLRARGTIEARLHDLFASKSALFDEIVNRLARPASRGSDDVPEHLLDFLNDTPSQSR